MKVSVMTFADSSNLSIKVISFLSYLPFLVHLSLSVLFPFLFFSFKRFIFLSFSLLTFNNLLFFLSAYLIAYFHFSYF